MRTMARRRVWTVAVALMVASLMVAACADDDDEGDQPATPGQGATSTTVPSVATLRFAVSTNERNITPFTQGTGYPGYYMMTLMYDTLLWLDPQGVPQPWLAREFQTSNGGRTWTLKLQEAVTWHDGRALSAADVKFSFEYIRDSQRPRWLPNLRPITSIETPDPLTVVLTLSEPKASFALNPLADLPIIPQHIWSGITNPLEVTAELPGGALPIGSGPYRLVEFRENQVWRFQANPNYFKGRPIVNEIVMPYIADRQAAFTALQGGQVDVTAATLTPELKATFNQGGLKTAGGAGLRGWYVYINNERAPFDRKEVRQAVALAIDFNDIVRTVLLGAGAAGSPGFVHRSVAWSNPARRDFRPDQNRARTLLDGAGIRDTNNDGVRELNGQPVEVPLILRNDDAQAVRAAELIAQSVSQIGIKVTATPLDPTTGGSRIWPDYQIGQTPRGDYTIALHSWAATVQQDPEFLRSLFHSEPAVGTLNRAAYKNPQYDTLADEQSRTTDTAQRNRILGQMQDILADDLPAIALYYPDDIFPYRPGTFDGWVYYPGTGILNKATLIAPK
ncbi:MAG: ABC transporter substrate-binding protein [Actinomycetota bacterium]|nr:ABC transporter substrate-binding protein [Actinomycetota bacterium]